MHKVANTLREGILIVGIEPTPFNGRKRLANSSFVTLNHGGSLKYIIYYKLTALEYLKLMCFWYLFLIKKLSFYSDAVNA